MRAFLSATARGYEMAAAHPQRASALLVEESRGALDAQFALSSQAYASKVGIILPGLQSPVRHCISSSVHGHMRCRVLLCFGMVTVVLRKASSERTMRMAMQMSCGC